MSGFFGRELKASGGLHQPFGATVMKNGVNFALYSANATRVQLLLWERGEMRRPSKVFELSPTKNKTGKVWHIFIENLPLRVRYAYRVDGPSETGNRFDFKKALLDPYARALDNRYYSRELACYEGDNVGEGVRGIVVGDDKFEWEGDKLPRLPLEKMVIYELHVKGFTYHQSSGVAAPGTFAGLEEKLPYLKDLGITTIELMPIQAFDDDIPYRNFKGEELINYWGYSQMSFFAIHPSYFASGKNFYLSELKKVVKKAHSLGLEIIMDVVFNHTTEANEYGPRLSWRGIDNQSYYLLSQQDKNYYMNFTGCDNTLNCNHPMVAKMIVDSLEYFATEFHVDGFRFDLGAIFYYTNFGFVDQPYVIELINKSPILSQLKLIAEPWDATGLNLEGRFGGPRWMEWNGSWRDRVRRFINRGEENEAVIKQHLQGKAPEFEFYHKNPMFSVNFVTTHDGFTLRDLVSYNSKHNEDNGYSNNDGSNDNTSNNFGVEGETDDQELIRLRQAKALEMLRLSVGVPGVFMLLMGDEMWRTQKGNNNAFTQDNEISWLDWNLLEQNRGWWQQVQTVVKAKSQSA